jgi:hypothetical protein
MKDVGDSILCVRSRGYTYRSLDQAGFSVEAIAQDRTRAVISLELQSVWSALRSPATKTWNALLRHSIRFDLVQCYVGDKQADTKFTAIVANTTCMQ